MKVGVESAAKRKGDEHADKSDDRKIGGLLAAPARDQPVVNEQQINQPGYEREQGLGIAHPGTQYLLSVKRSRKDAQGHQGKTDGKRAIGEIVANLKGRQSIEHALALEFAFLQQVQHGCGERDKESNVSQNDQWHMNVDPSAAQQLRDGILRVICLQDCG